MKYWQHETPLNCPKGHPMLWLGGAFWKCPKGKCDEIYVQQAEHCEPLNVEYERDERGHHRVQYSVQK